MARRGYRNTPQATITDDEIRSCIGVNRLKLAGFLEEFQYAETLFTGLTAMGQPHVDVIEQITGWRLIAAKQGALAIFNFGKALWAIKAQMKRSRTLSQSYDADKLELADKLFGSSFQHIVNVRHSIAHAGEVAESVERMKEEPLRSSHTGPGGSYAAAGASGMVALNGSTLSVGHRGDVFEVRIDVTSVAKLQRVMCLVVEALQAGREPPSPPGAS